TQAEEAANPVLDLGFTPHPTDPRVFIDTTGFQWRMLDYTTHSGYALIIAEHVHLSPIRYHNAGGFRPFAQSELFGNVDAWFQNDQFVSEQLRQMAVPYGFQRNDGTPGGNGVEFQATSWVNNVAGNNFREAHTVPNPASGGTFGAFLLSSSEVNHYFTGNTTALVGRRTQAVDEDGNIGANMGWWLRSPSVNSTSPVRRVDSNGLFVTSSPTSTSLRGVRPALWINLSA
ncbi:MAG: DUF6273 domain-containing protein, partial [Oscillospiraceae bacterium]|nr:DUF6273 domain-containing protein [Oscillospiraceae bacterium]